MALIETVRTCCAVSLTDAVAADHGRALGDRRGTHTAERGGNAIETLPAAQQPPWEVPPVDSPPPELPPEEPPPTDVPPSPPSPDERGVEDRTAAYRPSFAITCHADMESAPLRDYPPFREPIEPKG